MSHCCFGMYNVDHALQVALYKAKIEANEKQESIAVYEKEGQYEYCRAIDAYANKLNVKQVVSFNQPASS